MKSQTSLKEKLDRASRPHTTEAPERWVGGLKNKTMLIPSAWEIDAYIRQVPKGRTITVSQIREHFAKQYKVDITCPMTTGIFLRLVAEYAEEQRAEGQKDITPYWRVTRDNGDMIDKFPGGKEHQAILLKKEATSYPKT